MKLVKLSLAAVVAAGSFSFANAVALDEAIQNVDLSGYLRYRHDAQRTKTGDVTKVDNAQNHNYKVYLKATADIADNFKAVGVAEYSSAKENSYGKKSTKDYGFKVTETYLKYNNFDTEFSFGKMQLGTIWTDDLIGNALKVVNSSIDGVTFGAFAVDNLNDDGDFFANDDYRTKNIYGGMAAVDFAPVAAEAWVAYMDEVGTFFAVDANVNLGDDDFSYGVHAQYSGNSLKKERLSKASGEKIGNGNFYAIEAAANVMGFDVNLGYAGYGKKAKFTVHTIEDEGQLINYGDLVMKDYNGGEGRKSFIFGTVGYTYDDVRFGVDVINGTNKTMVSKEKLFEVMPKLSYKYSDKLNFSTFYAYGTSKWDGEDKSKTKKIRLEAKYSF